jgi:plastocyanin
MFRNLWRIIPVNAAILLAIVALVPAAYSYQAETVSNGGTITGVVKYGGPPPKPAQFQIGKDKDVCGAHLIYDQSLVVAPDGGVANAVVTITDIAKGKDFVSDNSVAFDQKGCEYRPHVIAFPAGATVEIINSDGILHSIHTESKINPVFDMAQPGFKRTIAIKVDKPEVIKVTCDAHNWMEGWWYVTGNPYYALTDAHGRFTLTDVPAGTYTLAVWQEKLGVIKRKVTVNGGATVVSDFTLQPKKD